MQAESAPAAQAEAPIAQSSSQQGSPSPSQIQPSGPTPQPGPQQNSPSPSQIQPAQPPPQQNSPSTSPAQGPNTRSQPPSQQNSPSTSPAQGPNTRSQPATSQSEVGIPIPVVQEKMKGLTKEDLVEEKVVTEKNKGPIVRSLGYDYLILEGEDEIVEEDEDVAVEEEDELEQEDDLVVEELIVPVIVEKKEEVLEEDLITPLLVEEKEEILPDGPYVRPAGYEYLVLEGVPEVLEEEEESVVEQDHAIALEEEEELIPEENHSDTHLALEEEVEVSSDAPGKLNPSVRSLITKPLQQYSESFKDKGVASKKKAVVKAERKVVVNSESQQKAKPKPSVRSIITKPLQHYTEAWSLLTPFFQRPVSLKGVVNLPSVQTVDPEPIQIMADDLVAEVDDPPPEEPPEEDVSSEEALAEDPFLSKAPIPTTPVPQNPPVTRSRRSTDVKWNNYPGPKRVSAYGVAGEGPINVESYFALQAMFAPQYPAYSVVPLVEATGYYFVDNTYGASLAIGGRYLPESLPMLIGFNTVGLYYQGQHGPLFQCGVGIEFIAKRWGFYAEGFIPTGHQVNIDKHSFNKIGGGFKARCTQIESTLTGFMSQASLLAYQSGDFFLYLGAGPYFLSLSRGGHTFWGGQFIIQPRYDDILSISLIINQDPFLGTTVQGEFVLSFPLYSLSRLKKYKGYRADRWINRQVYQPFYRAGPLPIDKECCWKSNFN